MFAYLVGKIADISEDNLVLEVNHIGFNIKIPSSLHSSLPGIGEEIKIHTYTCVREDSFQLYGFLTRDDLDMFRLLITVNGIGPKGGLAVLSVLSADDIRMAVLSQDAKTIAKAPGIGAKTAQRVILDLKDKVPAEALASGFLAPREEKKAMEGAAGEAVDALAALGYSQAEAYRAVSQVEIADGMTAEDVLKASLKHLAFL